MRVGLLTDKPDHPVLAVTVGLLQTKHTVEVINPDAPAGGPAGYDGDLADVFLLKSHSVQALALARRLEGLGARVVNDWAATEACQDRARMARRARLAGLPFPRTRTFVDLPTLIAYELGGRGLRFPLMVKSQRSRRGDLVARVDDLAQLRSMAKWDREPVVVQEFVPNDSWDHKLWVIGSEVFAGLRPTPLDVTAPDVTMALDPAELPSGWVDLARKAGNVFGLVVYGIDILTTNDGPVIVDVNAFPGCRNMPGAPEALAALVERLASGVRRPIAPPSRRRPPAGAARPAARMETRAVPTGEVISRRAEVPIAVVHETVRELLEKLDGARVCPDGPGSAPVSPPVWPRVVYLRRKPGRGLVAVYRLLPEGRHRRPTDAAATLVTASLAEKTLDGLRSGAPRASLDPAELEGSWPGVIRWPRMGIDLQAFPADVGLPQLSAVLAPASHPGLVAALTAACRTATGEAALRVVSIQATPERYKPGSRCVLRYRVTTSSTVAEAREFTFFGKLYRDRTAAQVAHELAERLWTTGPSAQPAATTMLPLVPRPVGVIDELGLVLTAAAEATYGGHSVAGTRLLRPPRPIGGEAAGHVERCRQALVATATALAWWHTSGVTAGLAQQDAGSTYATLARAWTAAVAAPIDQMAEVIDPLAEALAATASERAVPSHGAFKPSQLIFCGPSHPVVTDLDGVCLSDPAVDVGYFLAYLRPPGLWGGHLGPRAWFGDARALFVDAYLHALAARGTSPPEIQDIQGRISLFEAALILKIASRRARRLNSPRPSEVKVVMAEINGCLKSFSARMETRR